LRLVDKFPPGAGHLLQANHVQSARKVLEVGNWSPIQQPKLSRFAQNLRGNYRPVTIDVHNMRMWGVTDRFGRALDIPRPGDYGRLERMQQEQARLNGMAPAQYQASGWLGGADLTKLKSPLQPLLDTFEDRIRLSADAFGLTPETMLKAFV